MLAAWAVPAATQAGVAKISAIRLQVTHRPGPSGEWRRSTVGTSLSAGSRVPTGKRSACEIEFPDGSKVRMGSRSDCVITDPDNNRITVLAREVFANIASGAGGAEIEGATATATGRGTWLWYAGPTVPGQTAARDYDLASAWLGDAEFTSVGDSVFLDPGTWSMAGTEGGPTPPLASLPAVFGTGALYPWWTRLEPGVDIKATPGTWVGVDCKDSQITARIGALDFALGAMTGGQVDVAAAVYTGRLFAGAWGRYSAISGPFYAEAGLQAFTDFDGEIDSRASDLFLVKRQANADFVLGGSAIWRGQSTTPPGIALQCGALRWAVGQPPFAKVQSVRGLAERVREPGGASLVHWRMAGPGLCTRCWGCAGAERSGATSPELGLERRPGAAGDSYATGRLCRGRRGPPRAPSRDIRAVLPAPVSVSRC